MSKNWPRRRVSTSPFPHAREVDSARLPAPDHDIAGMHVAMDPCSFQACVEYRPRSSASCSGVSFMPDVPLARVWTAPVIRSIPEMDGSETASSTKSAAMIVRPAS